MSAQKTKPTNHRVPANSDKAQKLKNAVEQIFQEHKAKLGSKTLMSIAYSYAAG